MRTRSHSIRRSSIIATIGAVAIVLGGPALHAGAAPLATAAVQPAAVTAASTTTVLDRVLDETNAIRSKLGKRTLKVDARMQSVAMEWSKKQAEAAKMSHNPSYSTQIPSGWTRAGENVAMGYSYERVVQAWADSPGHYANMTGDFTHIGIGYAVVNGTPYYTQVFAKYASDPVVSFRPNGKFESAKGGYRKIRISGWALDKDTTASTRVRFTIDGRAARSTLLADDARTDVAALYPGYGANHGWEKLFAASKGSRVVCAWAVNAGPQLADRYLGCKRITVR